MNHFNVIESTVFGGTIMTAALWHLQASDVSVIISCCASLVALGIQFWVAREKVKALRRESLEFVFPQQARADHETREFSEGKKPL